MHRRRGGAERDEVVGVGRGDALGVDRAQPLDDLARPVEGHLHGHLLVEQHAGQQGEGVLGEDAVGLRFADEVERLRHVPIVGRLSIPDAAPRLRGPQDVAVAAQRTADRVRMPRLRRPFRWGIRRPFR